MPNQRLTTSAFRLGDWIVHPAEGVLRRPDKAVHLQPKVMEVLVLLADHADHVVSKESLLETVWSRTFVEEGALTQCIHSLRKGLDDSAAQQRYITTVPRTGYRLNGPVIPIEALATPLLAPSRLSHRREVGKLAAVFLTTLVVLTAWSQWRLESTMFVSTRLGEPSSQSLLVLPFATLAPSSEQQDFEDRAAGLQSLISHELGGLPNLTVKSKVTANWAAQSGLSLRDLGEELQLSYLVSGVMSLQPSPDLPARAASPLGRLDLSLFEVSEDRPIWTASYWVKLADIESLRADIADQIRSELGLSPPLRRSRLSAQPAATDAYLRGIALIAAAEYDRENVEKASDHFATAVALDPDFAEAHAEHSKALSWLVFNGERHHRETAQRSLDQARRLGPDLQVVHLANAFFLYRVEHDHERAIEEFRLAAQDRLESEEILLGIGYAQRRLGRLRESLGKLQEAFVRDPKNPRLAGEIAKTHAALRDFEMADQWYKHSLALQPDQPLLIGDQALNRLALEGCTATGCSTDEARHVLKAAEVTDSHELTYFRLLLDLYDASRLNDDAMRQAWGSALSSFDWLPDPPATCDGLWVTHDHALYWRRSWLLAQLGDPTFEAVGWSFVEWLECRREKTGAHPYPKDMAYLGLILALLGEPDAALHYAEQAVAAATVLGRYNSPRHREALAQVLLLRGEPDEAWGVLEDLLETPYQYAVTEAQMRLDPQWRSLRGVAGFNRLLR